MRIQYKGGVWKNSEDEILKAAVMKYGKNQWARIASLLVRKSAKQCKARWFEWLDPAIKKTQWTREEEEKLLHLAKIMPTSWRTIAPMIGRTATQCLEHYEKLLDDAQRGPEESQDGAGPSAAGGVTGNKPRPGDKDAFPESRPARPDPVDMDEDELEMLSEARARLANTKGKKAKRKAREKQLEAAKRLAQLQKRRELKAAGVEMKPPRKNRKVTDYATEIPFERTPAPGFYDTRGEDDRVASESMGEKKQLGKLLQKYKGKTEAEKEEEAQKRDAEKRKRLEKTNLPAALGLDKKSASPQSPPLKRARLALPAPQVSDFELERIAKDGASSGRPRSPNGTQKASNGHAAEIKGDTFINSVASTPIAPTEPWAAVRHRQLETIRKLKVAQTPLQGGEGADLELGLESGVTPMRSEMRTPNPLATPMSVSNESHEVNDKSQVARAQEEKARRLRELVRTGLQSLPEPENEYQVELDPEMRKGNQNDEMLDAELPIVEDAEDEAIRKKSIYRKQIDEAKKDLLSCAAKRSLPIPKVNLGSAQNQDRESVAFLVQRDNEVHAILQQGTSDSRLEAVAKKLHSLQDPNPIDKQFVEIAQRLLDEEMMKEKDGGKEVIAEIVEYLNISRPLTNYRVQ